MHSLLKSTQIAGVVIAASSLFLIGACSSNPEPAPAPTVPSTSPAAESPEAPGSTSGFMGTSALPESIQNFTPDAIKEAIGSCVESDDSKPVIFGSESVHGFTCVMAVGDGGTAMLSTAEDPATVSRINEKAESVENYVPYELPGKHAFSGVNKGSPFVMVIDEDNRIYQEFVFANIGAEAAQPLIDEIIQDFQ